MIKVRMCSYWVDEEGALFSVETKHTGGGASTAYTLMRVLGPQEVGERIKVLEEPLVKLQTRFRPFWLQSGDKMLSEENKEFTVAEIFWESFVSEYVADCTTFTRLRMERLIVCQFID